jgi:NAD(P)-dependent dehydrogenase (short-subunit alcohol dehydrogenase family)
MKIIAITGSTRGIGFGLANAFLAQGCAVAISGRAAKSVEQAIAELTKKHPAERIVGHACDVAQRDQVQGLWDAVQQRFGRVDIWVNNAGIAHPEVSAWDVAWKLPAGMPETVLSTNILGTIHGCGVAMHGMLAQGGGAIYNMYGYGSHGGAMQAGLSLYGTSKAAVRFYTDSLIRETRRGSIIVGSLSPGMVLTDMLLRRKDENPAQWEQLKRILNILAEKVEVVCPRLAEQMLANQKHGTNIAYNSTFKLMMRFLTAPIAKRKIVD